MPSETSSNAPSAFPTTMPLAAMSGVHASMPSMEPSVVASSGPSGTPSETLSPTGGIRGSQRNATEPQDVSGEDNGGGAAIAVVIVIVIIVLLALAYYCFKRKRNYGDGESDLTDPLIANEAEPHVSGNAPSPAPGPAPSPAPSPAPGPATSPAPGPTSSGIVPLESGKSRKSFRLSILGTNLAGIGSDDDKVARQAAAELDFGSEGVGSVPGVEIWRVEKKETVTAWPRELYGQFHRGDAYIVLGTEADPKGKLLWDIHFWIGSQCSPLSRGVAAVKAVELDDLLGGEPMQHRQVEGIETEKFLSCFPKGVTYLEGGTEFDFRKVSEMNDSLRDARHLYRVVKEGKVTRYFEVPFACSSLNEGDAFMLDAGTKIFTWFGKFASGFERITSTALAQELKDSRVGRVDCECFVDVGDDNEEFFELLGGKEEIAPAEEVGSVAVVSSEKHMYIVSDAEGFINVEEVSMSLNSLVSEDVFIVDCGDDLYVWVGKGSTTAEREQSMIISYSFLEELGRFETTRVHRIKEGQEYKIQGFLDEFQ